MSNAIEHLLVSPGLREEMGSKGYTHVREKFSYENTVERLRDIYRSAIERGDDFRKLLL
jgi:glycosyltransferase involved in cell wall biosynthesis